MRSSPIRFPGQQFVRIVGSACLVLAPLVLAGCGTASIDDAVPGARRTGQFPNLNVPQQAAGPQLTDEQAQAGIARLSTVRASTQARTAAPVATSQADALRKLGAEHAGAALKQIEE